VFWVIALVCELLEALFEKAVLSVDADRELDQWATANGYRIVSVKPATRVGRFPLGTLFDLTVVDQQSIERSGIARIPSNIGHPVAVKWRSARQLDWRRHGSRASWSDGPSSAQGWCADPTGRHEQRWFSAGEPTNLVRDGGTETRG
jgi:hypothetical protein